MKIPLKLQQHDLIDENVTNRDENMHPLERERVKKSVCDDEKSINIFIMLLYIYSLENLLFSKHSWLKYVIYDPISAHSLLQCLKIKIVDVWRKYLAWN